MTKARHLTKTDSTIHFDKSTPIDCVKLLSILVYYQVLEKNNKHYQASLE